MRLTRPAALFLAAALAASACSSSDDSVVEPADGTDATIATTSTTPSSTTTSVSEATAPDPAGASAAWVQMWDGAEKIVTDPAAAQQEMLAVASQPVVDQLDTIYNPTVTSEAGSSPRTFDNNPVVVVQANGTVTIDDCLFESPRAGNATIWYSGTAEPVAEGWTITSVTLNSEIGCVPAAMAAEALAGYEAYWDARVAFWDPADASNPLVAQTTTGAHLDLLSSLLVDHASRGLALRGRPATHPEIIEVRSATEVAVLDCSEQDPGRGLFVFATSERLTDIPAVRDGQLDLTSSVMVLEGGAWKVSDVQGQADVSCDMAPTTQGLPVV